MCRPCYNTHPAGLVSGGQSVNAALEAGGLGRRYWRTAGATAQGSQAWM